MPNRSRKPKLPDPNLAAFSIIAKLDPPPPVDDGKDPAAVELGRKGGLKGGKARAESMTKKQRSDAARKAAQVRWGS